MQYIKPYSWNSDLASIVHAIHRTLQLEQLGDALHTHHDPPSNKDVSMNPVLQALSSKWGTQLDQITALILAAEACSGGWGWWLS